MDTSNETLHLNCPKCTGHYLLAAIRRERECLKDIFENALSTNRKEAINILRSLIRNNYSDDIEFLWSDVLEDSLDDCTRCDLLKSCVACLSYSSLSFFLKKGFLSAARHTCEKTHPFSIMDDLARGCSLIEYIELLQIIKKQELEEECYALKDPGII